jgi:FtsZ-binding cell division protein ZapB
MDSYIQSSEIFKKVFVEAVNSALQETLTPLYAEIKSLKSEVSSLRSELSEVKAKANENEQYSRRNNIRICRLGEENNENCYELRLCDELNLDVKRNELDCVHRAGRARNMTHSSSNPVHPRPMN